MEASISIPADRLKLFQDLVKHHDLRFKGNPFVWGSMARVNIDGSHLPMSVCNAFFDDWNRFNTPIVEIASPLWKKVLRRLGLKFVLGNKK